MAVRKTHEAELAVHQPKDSFESDGGSDAEKVSDGGGSDAEKVSDGGGSDAEKVSDGGSDAEKISDGGGSSGEEEKKDGEASGAGWADAMAKILGKKISTSGSNILMKSKELEKKKEAEKQEQQKRQKQENEKRRWEMMFREKPDVSKDRETEKALQRIATRGVVQLFNAVRKHQKTVKEAVKEAGGSERKKAKILSSVSKKDFISVLRREDRGAPTQDDVAPEEEKPSWSVLRDDFMMGASMKDWDRDSDKDQAELDSRGGPDSDSD